MRTLYLAGPNRYGKGIVNQSEAIKELRARADEIARTVTSMHPIAPDLREAGVQGEIIRALFELTKQVEVIKKHLLRLEKRDDSVAL